MSRRKYDRQKGAHTLSPVKESAIGALLDQDSAIKAEEMREEDKGNALKELTQLGSLESDVASQQPSRLQQHAEAIISDLEQEVQGLVVALTSTQKKLVNAEDKLAKQDERLEKEKQEREEKTEYVKENKITRAKLQQLERVRSGQERRTSSSCKVSENGNGELNEAHARKRMSQRPWQPRLCKTPSLICPRRPLRSLMQRGRTVWRPNA